MPETAVLRERERLLSHAAAILGLLPASFALTAAVLPGALPTPAGAALFGAALLLHLGGHIAGAVLHSPWSAALAIAAGLLAALCLDGGDRGTGMIPAAFLLAGSIPAAAPALVATRPARVGIVLGAAATVWASWWLFGERGWRLALLCLAAWTLSTLAGWWLHRSFPRTAQAIVELGRAHQAERHASELEAQRRQGARLLHDTVLATLTLLAHSGVGVPETALRQQARQDARLLRQLREGASPSPHASYDDDTVPGDTAVESGRRLQELVDRFGGLGLRVTLIGDLHPVLRHEAQEAFLLALAECLENVRRHSAVDEASVTLKQDARTLRALVSDSGVGFHLDHVESGHLGVKESMQARLREIGGSARLFSAPGSGTTVVLEVPR